MLRALFLNALLVALVVWGEIKPGYLDFDNLPETNFSCEGKVIGGYYADVETGCQMFHVCTIGQKGEVSDIKFLCLNGTVFDQETRVCERIDEVDCDKSESFFGLNLELYGNTPIARPPECDGDCEEEEEEEEIEYDDLIESSTEVTTTTTKATTTTTTTTTTPRPIVTTPKVVQYSSSGDSVVALLALHNAFTQGLRRPTSRPTTRRPNINLNLRTRFTAADARPQEGYSLSRPTFLPSTLPTPLKANYHHFESGDTLFTHSFDPDRPYHFQFFSQKSSPSPFRLDPEPVSIVTSTSTSTSVRIANSTVEYPTAYDDYPDGVDHFFQDIPKLIRPKRSVFIQYSLPQNQKHDFPIEIDNSTNEDNKTQFLENLLNSMDLGETERKQIVELFKEAEPEINEVKEKGMDMMLERLENRLMMEMGVEGKEEEAEFAYEGEAIRERREVEPKRRRVKVRRPVDSRKAARTTRPPDIRPVTEEIDDITTVEYRRPAPKPGRDPTTSYPPVSARLQTRFDYNNTFRRANKVSTTKKSSTRHTPVREDELAQASNPDEVRVRPLRRRPSAQNQNKELEETPVRFEPRSRGVTRSRTRDERLSAQTSTTSTTPEPFYVPPGVEEDPDFSCHDKVQGGLYADVHADCQGFFICTQGKDGVEKSHFWCGEGTRFNQKSRTCQVARLVRCSLSTRYYYLNNNQFNPSQDAADKLLGDFEPMRTG